MKVSQENLSDLTFLIKIEVEESDYKQAVEKQLKGQRKKMNVPGFRAGQVPLSMVKKMYETPVKAQEIEKLMSDNLYKFISDNNINVLGSPLADDEKTPAIDWEKDKEFTFYFDVATQPDVVINLEKEKATYYELEPTDEVLDKFVEDIRYRYGKVEYPETIGENDMVYGHLEELQEDGQKKEDGIDVNSTLFVDRISLKTIKDKFIGKKKDDTIVFKPSKAIKDASQLAAFLRKKVDEVKDFASDVRFTVNNIQRMTMAEMNEDFYSRAYKGKEIKDEKDFRNVAKQDLCNTYTRESDTYFLNKTSEYLVKNIKFDLPEEFLKRWLIATNDGKISKEEIETNFDKYLDGIRWQIIESKLAEMYDISVKDEDMLSYYKTELLPMYFPAPENETEEQKTEREAQMDSVAKNMLKESEQSRQVYNYLFDRKMTLCLKNNMKVSNKKVDTDEFQKLVSEPKTEKKTTKKKSSAKAEQKEETTDQPSLF